MMYLNIMPRKSSPATREAPMNVKVKMRVDLPEVAEATVGLGVATTLAVCSSNRDINALNDLLTAPQEVMSGTIWSRRPSSCVGHPSKGKLFKAALSAYITKLVLDVHVPLALAVGLTTKSIVVPKADQRVKTC